MSSRAKSRPESSCLKYTRSSIPGSTSLIVVSSIGRTPRLRLRGQRLESRHQLLDLGARLAQPLVELVDQRRRPLQPGHQDVHVHLTLLEEVDDPIELTARLGVAQL